MHHKFVDITGNKYGKLTAIKFSHISNTGYSYWEFKCDCGNTSIINKYNVVKYKQKGCGCGYKHSKEDAPIRECLSDYKGSAKKRNLIFSLDYEDFKKLVISNCYYCGISPVREIISHGKKIGKVNGIDRVDNNIGYIKTNCVSCCKFCNFAKSNSTKEEFETWLNYLISRVR